MSSLETRRNCRTRFDDNESKAKGFFHYRTIAYVLSSKSPDKLLRSYEYLNLCLKVSVFMLSLSIRIETLSSHWWPNSF